MSTNTGHAHVSRIRETKVARQDRLIVQGRGIRSKTFRLSQLNDALAYRDAQLGGRRATKRPRWWHRSDHTDLGPSATTVERHRRRQEHRDYAEWLKARDLIGEYDDVKLATVGHRDLLGTAACMDLDARERRHEHGKIIVPAPIDATLSRYARKTFGVRVVVKAPA